MKTRRLFLTGAAMVLFVLLAHACKTLTPEETKAIWLKPENNRFSLDLRMADKTIPYTEQSFLYCIGSFSVKDRVAMAYTKPDIFSGMVAVISPGNKQLWVKYETANRSYALTTGERNATGTINFTFEAGQSYLVGALWDKDIFIIDPLDDNGIEDLCRREWEKTLHRYRRFMGLTGLKPSRIIISLMSRYGR